MKPRVPKHTTDANRNQQHSLAHTAYGTYSRRQKLQYISYTALISDDCSLPLSINSHEQGLPKCRRGDNVQNAQKKGVVSWPAMVYDGSRCMHYNITTTAVLLVVDCGHVLLIIRNVHV